MLTSTRRESKSVECQTSLTWSFSERPLRTTKSNVRSSGGPGSVSTCTQASSGKSRTVSADARVPCESAKCSSETGVQPIPPKRPLGVLPIPTKWHLRVQRLSLEKKIYKKMQNLWNYILFSHDLLIVCKPNMCLPIQMQDSAKNNVTSENIYSLPSAPHTHTKASVHVGIQMWLGLELKWGGGRDRVGNIQGGGWKFLGRLIRHCRSRKSSESSKQGHTMRINPTISTVLYCTYTPFIIRSGSSFRVTVHTSQVPMLAKNISRTGPFPNADFIR